MKGIAVVLTGLIFWMSTTVLAQNTTEQTTGKQNVPERMSAKTLTVVGMVGSEGKAITTDGETWTVSNPEALKEQAGREATIKVRIDSSAGEVYVVKVKEVKRTSGLALGK